MDEIPRIRKAQSCATDACDAVREFHAAVVQPDMALVVFFCSVKYDLDTLALEMQRHLYMAALTDPLTGVPNRRAWDIVLPQQIERTGGSTDRHRAERHLPVAAGAARDDPDEQQCPRTGPHGRPFAGAEDPISHGTDQEHQGQQAEGHPAPGAPGLFQFQSAAIPRGPDDQLTIICRVHADSISLPWFPRGILPRSQEARSPV